MKKIIDIKHHCHDYECMWNGIEDIYIEKTNENLPENFFFLLSGFGSFCYLKTNKSDLKRMVLFGDGRTKKMYEFLSPIVGFQFHHYECKSFEKALYKAKKEIDTGYPVILGALDMFYLSYYDKLYQNEHIPFHYVLMVGYDDDKQEIYLYDCGRTELLTLAYNDLSNSMNCSYPGLSKEYTICTIRLGEAKNKLEIACEALSLRRDVFLYPQKSFLGYKGFEKFIKELPQWIHEMAREDYDKILLNMLTFFGSVPSIPNAIKGINEPDTIVYKGGFDKMSDMLNSIGKEYAIDSWQQASKLFALGACEVEKISNILIAYFTKKEDQLQYLPSLFSRVLKYQKEGFYILDLEYPSQNL